ncbi:hypothetical protein [Urbifossiella limnaea]|uniref:Uncharacterized protein n=1 Tax=Urbifossiella limnaea TaxID=2528023 RepID=A0A517XU13_9BACT|nr:hypothetical protein [Urbifossiella limnaea]QDU21010.1 hypothetical protein ETAA1_29730 [Urbifossiella limnaea]
MSGDEQDDEVRDSIERIDRARRKRSDAAWRPFEEKWAALIAARYAAVLAVYDDGPVVTAPEVEAGSALDALFPEMVREAARVACEQDFETRRGVRVLDGVLGGDDVCVVYNNNPYQQKLTRRDQELGEVRRWLADNADEVAELAYAEYPDLGRDEGYTYALLLRCDPGFVGEVAEQYQAATDRSLADLTESVDDGGAFGDE